ncbi:hypothetical protein [Methanoculleus chikugoensis]|uniref:hypothetical protein n=1 Tax=Methanoculleus chikugoensis TaxID=118126 RepID=UPI001FB1EAC7|nr:hypothetical protein [Methanoculleus chikugoensis]
MPGLLPGSGRTQRKLPDGRLGRGSAEPDVPPAAVCAHLGLLHQLRPVRGTLPDGYPACALLPRRQDRGRHCIRAQAREGTLYQLTIFF